MARKLPRHWTDSPAPGRRSLGSMSRTRPQRRACGRRIRRAAFTSKATVRPTPFEGPAEAYRKTAESVGRGLFVGEVRLPAKAFGDFAGRVRSYGEQMAAKAGLYASARGTGTVSVFPFFRAPANRGGGRAPLDTRHRSTR